MAQSLLASLPLRSPFPPGEHLFLDWAGPFLSALDTGILVTGPIGEVLFLNNMAQSLLGLSGGLPLQNAIQGLLHFVDNQGRPLSVEKLPMFRVLEGQEAEAELVVMSKKDAVSRPLRIHSRLIFDAQKKRRYVLSEVKDVATETRTVDSLRHSRRRLEERFDRLMRLHEMTAGWYAFVDTRALVEQVVSDCINGFSAQGGALYLADSEAGALECQHHQGGAEEAWNALKTLDGAQKLQAAFLKRELSSWKETQADTCFIALPIIQKQKSIGLLLLGFDEELPTRRMEHAFWASVGEQIANTLEKCQLFEREHRARAEAQAARERAVFLADASALLLGDLPLEEALAELCQRVTQRWADFCEVILLDETEGVLSAAVAGAEGKSVASLVQARGLGTGVVFRTLFQGTTEKWLSGEPEPVLSAMGLNAAWVVPLKARSRLMGAMCWAAQRCDVFCEDDLGLLQNLADLTALSIDNVRLLAQANISVRTRDHLLAILSHDVRTPLSVMQMKAQQLRRRLPAHSQLLELVDAIVHAGWNTNDLIRDLLDVAALHRKQAQLRLSPLPVTALLAEVIEKQHSVFPQRKVTWQTERSTEEAVLMVDRPFIVRAVWHLIDLALRHTPHEKDVLVRVNKASDKLELLVQDGGPGLSQEALDNIFGKYWRMGPELSSLGLGLYLAREWAQAHKGALEVESTPGEGTTVRLTLPLAAH